jgi:hypothetical protein
MFIPSSFRVGAAGTRECGGIDARVIYTGSQTGTIAIALQ